MVSVEGRQASFHEMCLRQDVDGEAFVPVGGRGGGEVGEGTEARVALGRALGLWCGQGIGLYWEGTDFV
jgi:hypothetical protein